MSEQSAEAVELGFIRLLVWKGPSAIPEQYRQPTIDAFVRRMSDPVSGFAFFFFWLGMVWVKGSRGDAERGWQRAFPLDSEGNPRPRGVDSTGKTWAWQLEVALQIVLYPVLLVLKARQIGFTYLVANLILWAALALPEQIISVIANKQQSAERIVRRVRNMYNRQPDWFRELYPMSNPAIRRLEFANGSYIEPYSGDPDAARSESASWVFVDEIGEIDRLYDFYAATEAVADNGGQLVMFGTAKDNGLYEWCYDATQGTECSSVTLSLPDGEEVLPVYDGANEMHFLFVPWYVHPARDDAWMERKRRTFRGNLANLEREYPSTWEQAFIANGLGYFDNGAMKRTHMEVRDLWEARDRRGTLLAATGDPRDVRFVEDPYGHVVIHATAEEFDTLLRTGRPFVGGVDCAGIRVSGDGDSHAASFHQLGIVPVLGEAELPEGVELMPHRQLLTIHGRMDPDFYSELLVRAGYLCGTALLGIEVNGVGTAVVKGVRRLKYPAIFKRRTKPTSKHDKPTTEYGWYTGGGANGTKHIAYGEFERCFRNGWSEIRDPETLLEMGNVVHLGGGKIGARDPKHDDRPDAAAIAHGMIPYARSYLPNLRSREEGRHEPGSLEWWLEQDTLEKSKRTRLGYENSAILT